MPRVPALLKPPQREAHTPQPEAALVTREYPGIVRKTSATKLNKRTPCKHDRRNSEKTGSSVVTTDPALPGTPSFSFSLYRRREPGPTLVPGYGVHIGAVHQDNQEEEKGCGEAEPVHLGGGLAGGS